MNSGPHRVRRVFAFTAACGVAAGVLWLTRTTGQQQKPPSSERAAAKPPAAQGARAEALGPSAAAMAPVPDVSGQETYAKFDAWAAAYVKVASGARAAIVAEGKAAAAARRAALKALIPQDPERALRLAVRYSVRQQLPREVVAQLEEPVSNAGDYDVTIECGVSGSGSRLERFAVFGERRLHAYTYGDRLDITTKRKISLHGIAVDDVMALSAEPVRVIPADERIARGLAAVGVAVEVRGAVRYVPDETAAEALSAALLESERTLGPDPGPAYAELGGGSGGEAAAPPSSWTEGAKTMLYIRCRFADEPAGSEPVPLSTVQANQSIVDQFWQKTSYGKTSLTTTFTDVVTLPKNGSAYTNDFPTLLSDARAAAVGANAAWNSNNFSLYAVITSNGSFSYAGKANVGAAGCHLSASYTSLRTAGHEFGHNLGLQHANYWRTDSPSPVGRDSVPGGYVNDGTNAEWLQYGHRYSVMGAQSGTDPDNPDKPQYSVFEKVKLNWLTSADYSVIKGSSTQRIYRFDHQNATGTRGVKINIASGDYTGSARRYWLSYRLAFNTGTSGIRNPNGLQVEWGKTTYGTDGAIQLDLTPFSNDSTTYYDSTNPQSGYWTIDNADKEDAVLVIGRTYDDRTADLHITPIGKGGTSPNEWMDVVIKTNTQTADNPPALLVNASASQVATNQSITFTASASDPDGDTLAYWWDFGDHSLVPASLNNPVATKSWSSAGQYLVRVVASDMKGGETSQAVLVTVGSPSAKYEIRGRILQGGRPVADARVTIGTTKQAWTSSDGSFAITGLSGGNYSLGAAKEGLNFTPQFTNPVSVGPQNAYGCDFRANQGLSGNGGLTITVSAFQVVAPQGGGVQFVATGWDNAGNIVPITPAWSVNGGGTIDSTGYFSATTAGGAFTVTASSGGVSGTAMVVAGSGVFNVGLPVLTLAAPLNLASETGPVAGSFTFTRSGPPVLPLTAHFSLAYGTGEAIDGADYEAIGTSVTIPAGATSVSLPISPIPDSEAEGDERVTLTVAADTAYTAGIPASGFVTIKDLPRDSWRKQHFGQEANVRSISGDSADPEGDGLVNLLEYALGLDPLAFDGTSAPTASLEGGFLVLSYTRSLDATDITITPLVSDRLGSWSSEGVIQEVMPPVGRLQIIKAKVRADGARRFLKLQASDSQP